MSKNDGDVSHASAIKGYSDDIMSDFYCGGEENA